MCLLVEKLAVLEEKLFMTEAVAACWAEDQERKRCGG